MEYHDLQIAMIFCFFLGLFVVLLIILWSLKKGHTKRYSKKDIINTKPQVTNVYERMDMPYICEECGLGMSKEDYVCPRCLSRRKLPISQWKASTTASKEIFCTDCGAKLDSDADFCTDCGAEV